jgi:protein-S-isoprenylcysteine O-methyltransferase Ste14
MVFMPEYFAALTLVLFVGTVLARVLLLKRKGVRAVYFGNLDKKDFLIPPFVLLYFYLIFANAFHLPTISTQEFFHSDFIQWMGVMICLAALLLVLWSLVSFGRSFRVGIDTEHPDKLVTSGAFAYSRNPIYVAFALILLGQFLIFPNWLLLVYVFAGVWLFHRQVLREEAYLKKHYGKQYREYSHRVRRYL